MSHERQSRFASKDRIVALLEHISSNIKFEAHHQDLLNQYRNIGYGEEAAIERVAAIKAHQELSSKYEGLTLSELGVMLPAQDIRVYNHSGANRLTNEECDYIERTARANIDFLELWDKLRRSGKAAWAETNRNQAYYQQQVADVLNQSEAFLGIPSYVVAAIGESGYQMPADFNFSPAGFAKDGLRFTATKENGDEIEVSVAGSSVYWHVDEKSGNLMACEKQSQTFARQLIGFLKQSGHPILGSFELQTEGQGFGKGQIGLSKTKEASQDAGLTTAPSTPKPLTLGNED